MEKRVVIAHDIICPWCWIGLFQVKAMEAEFGVTVDWVGHELFPEGMEWGYAKPADPQPENKPTPPTRLELAYAAQGMAPPTSVRPQKMRSHNVLEVFELAKEKGVLAPTAERLYRALWEEGAEVNDVDVLVSRVSDLLSADDVRNVTRQKTYDAKIVKFDDESYAQGVYNVPTFFIDGKRYGEQPYSVLRAALKAWLG